MSNALTVVCVIMHSVRDKTLTYLIVGRYLTRTGISFTLECTESKWCCTWIVNRLQQRGWKYTDLLMLMETSQFPNSLEVVVLCLYVLHVLHKKWGSRRYPQLSLTCL